MKKVILLIMLACLLTACNMSEQSSEENIQVYIDSAKKYFEQENYDMAKENFQKALSLAKTEYGEESKEAAEICIEIALHSTTYREALDYAKLGEDIYIKLGDMGGLAETYDAYGLIYERRRESELAREAYEEALKYCDKSDGDQSKKKFNIYMELSGLDICSDEDALYYSKEAEKLIEKLPDEEKNEATVSVYYSIGNSYYNQEQYSLAAENYEKAIACWNQSGEGELLYIIENYDHCGYSYAAIGDYEKAIEYINQSLTMLDDLDNARLWKYAVAYRHLSVTYTAADIEDYDQAMEYGLKSCKVYTKEKELSNEELEELKMMKEGLQSLYEESPLAGQQDFETWYQNHISQ